MRLLLINPNTRVATTQAMLEIAREALPGGTTILGATASRGADLITDEAALDIAGTEIAAIAAALDPSGLNGVVIAAFGDPGLAAARSCLPVPVTGLAEASMLEAGGDGRRFAVVTTTPRLGDAIFRCAERYGVARQLIGLRFTPSAPAAVMSDSARLEMELYDACRMAIASDGAEAIVIGGGPLAVAARALRTRIEVPLVEPVPSVVRLAVRLAGSTNVS